MAAFKKAYPKNACRRFIEKRIWGATDRPNHGVAAIPRDELLRRIGLRERSVAEISQAEITIRERHMAESGSGLGAGVSAERDAGVSAPDMDEPVLLALEDNMADDQSNASNVFAPLS